MFSVKDLPEKDIIHKKLKQVSFFSMFTKNEDAITKIAKICSMRHIKKDKLIIKEGEYGDELFIILKGEIEILKKTLQNEKYTVITQNSDFGSISVGELALIDNDQRSASVLAKTDCECLVINRKNFIEFGNKYPEIGLHITRAIAKQLSARLRKMNLDVITLFSALLDEISENE